MRSAIARRSLLRRLASLPIFATAGASLFAKQTEAAATSIMRQIDEAEQRCRAAQTAFDEALTAFEADVPQPPLCLLEWDRYEFTFVNERRFFDGEIVERGKDRLGGACRRSIATVASLNRDLSEVQPWDRLTIKLARGLRRHAARHEIEIRAAEEAFRLSDLATARYWAERAVRDLAEAIFAKPAVTLPEVRVQARMLCAFQTTHQEQWATFRAGHYGLQLATNVDSLAA